MTPALTPEQQLARAQELADLKEVLDTPAGRRLVWRLLEKARLFDVLFTGDSKTYYHLGRRDYMMALFRDVHELGIDYYVQLVRENKTPQMGQKGGVNDG